MQSFLWSKIDLSKRSPPRATSIPNKLDNVDRMDLIFEQIENVEAEEFASCKVKGYDINVAQILFDFNALSENMDLSQYSLPQEMRYKSENSRKTGESKRKKSTHDSKPTPADSKISSPKEPPKQEVPQQSFSKTLSQNPTALKAEASKAIYTDTPLHVRNKKPTFVVSVKDRSSTMRRKSRVSPERSNSGIQKVFRGSERRMGTKISIPGVDRSTLRNNSVIHRHNIDPFTTSTKDINNRKGEYSLGKSREVSIRRKRTLIRLKSMVSNKDGPAATKMNDTSSRFIQGDQAEEDENVQESKKETQLSPTLRVYSKESEQSNRSHESSSSSDYNTNTNKASEFVPESKAPALPTGSLAFEISSTNRKSSKTIEQSQAVQEKLTDLQQIAEVSSVSGGQDKLPQYNLRVSGSIPSSRKNLEGNKDSQELPIPKITMRKKSDSMCEISRSEFRSFADQPVPITSVDNKKGKALPQSSFTKFIEPSTPSGETKPFALKRNSIDSGLYHSPNDILKTPVWADGHIPARLHRKEYEGEDRLDNAFKRIGVTRRTTEEAGKYVVNVKEIDEPSHPKPKRQKHLPTLLSPNTIPSKVKNQMQSVTQATNDLQSKIAKSNFKH